MIKSRLVRVAATGVVCAGPCSVLSILFSCTANGSAIINNSTGGGGDDVATLRAVANDDSHWTVGADGGALFTLGVYVTLAGAGAECTVEILDG